MTNPSPAKAEAASSMAAPGKEGAWYRALYGLAVTYKHLYLCLDDARNCAEGKEPGSSIGTQRALAQAKAGGRRLLKAIVADEPSRESSNLGPLLCLMEPTAIIFLSSVLALGEESPPCPGVPDTSTVRFDRERLAELLASDQLSHADLVAFTLNPRSPWYHRELPYQARYSLACYFTALLRGDDGHDERCVSAALDELEPALEAGRGAAARTDPALQPLKRAASGRFDLLIAKYSGAAVTKPTSGELATVDVIGKTFAEALAKEGIGSPEALLARLRTKKARAELAKKLGAAQPTVESWIHAANLLRVEGVGPKRVNLLRAAGVTSLDGLAAADPDELWQVMKDRNGAAERVKSLPPREEVAIWKSDATALARAE